MRKMLIVLCAVAALALLALPAQAFHDGLGGREAPNRSPQAFAGPDQRLMESEVILLNGENAFDPDPDDNEDLVYEWTIDKRPSYVKTVSGFPTSIPIPLQEGQECIVEDEMGIELDDWIKTYHAPYLPPGNPGRVEIVFNLTVFDRDPQTVKDLYPIGDSYDADGDNIDDYEHGWNTTGNKWHTQKENQTARANQLNHMSWDTLTVIVDNTNHPPHGDTFRGNGIERDLCKEPHFIEFYVRHFRSGVDDEFEAPVPEYGDDADVDLWEHRDDYLEFYVQAADDEGIAVVEVYLYHEDRVAEFEKATKKEFLCQIDDVNETYRFALGRESIWDEPFAYHPGFEDPSKPGGKDSYPSQLYRGQTLTTHEKTENWTGRMPVSTPQLVEGEYRACARAFDKYGASQIADPESVQIAVGESLQDDQSPPCLSILAPGVDRAITPPVPESLPAKVPIKKFECTYPEPSPPTCDVFPPQIIGVGGVVRLDVGIIPRGVPGDGEYEPETDFLIEKVLIQNELDTPTGPMLGPETVLASPYVINLDTLALETSRVYVRAYDRVGGMEEMCIPITPDIHDPRVLARVPTDVYWGVNSTWRYYLQDKVPATSLQTITDFDMAGLTKKKPSQSMDHVTTMRSTDGRVVVLPPLAVFPHYDVSGDGVLDAVIDTAALTDPARLTDARLRTYNAYWDYQTQELVPLTQGRCDGGRTPDYYVESDNARGCGEKEKKILAAEPSSTSTDGLAPTAEQRSAGLPDDLVLLQFLSDRQTRVLEHYVTPAGVQPLGTYSWHTILLDDAENRMFVKGTVDLSRYFTDLGIKQLSLRDPERGRLPGDAVNLTGTVIQQTGLEEVPLEFSYAWDSDPWQVYEGLDLLGRQAMYEAMVMDGEILLYQCIQVDEGEAVEDAELQPCPLEVGKEGNVTLDRTFGPGIHEVTLRVQPAPLVNETDLSNNTLSHRFEVYLGRTDVGDKSYYIRAGENGMPRIKDGAIDLETNKTYDVRLGEWTTESELTKGARSVYLFEVDGKTYFWDPTERRDPTDTEVTCHKPGDRFVSTCRPITVFEEAYDPPASEDAPGISTLLAGVLLLSAVALARRRR